MHLTTGKNNQGIKGGSEGTKLMQEMKERETTSRDEYQSEYKHFTTSTGTGKHKGTDA